MPMDRKLAERFAGMSPYLFRDVLIGHARLTRGPEAELLDATRDAPNWQQRDVQLAWHVLGLYCDYVFGVVGDPGNVRLMPGGGEVDHRAAFERYAEGTMDLRESLAIGADFLTELWPHLSRKVLPGRSESDLIEAFTRAMSGGPYPSPANLDFAAPIVRQYLGPRLFAQEPSLAEEFEMHLTPGAGAGLVQVAHTLARNGLLAPGDKVALVAPLPQPLADLFARQLGCEIVGLFTDPRDGYQPLAGELAKLADPAVKALVLVSPGDPAAVVVAPETLAALAPILARRPDLLIIADHSGVGLLAAPAPSALEHWPRQTIGVYGFGRDFGLAGARLGVVLVHQQGVADDLLRALPAASRAATNLRYAARLPQPAAAGFLARLVEESAGVAFGHVAGLSGPDQVLLCLCAAYEAIGDPVAGTYFDWVRQELARREAALYRGLDLPPPDARSPWATRHCALVDLRQVAVAAGRPLAMGLREVGIWALLLHLAHEAGTIVMPALPCGGESYSVRVPLVGLGEAQYEAVGCRLREAVWELGVEGPCPLCEEVAAVAEESGSGAV